jgi:hypothetical protein
MSHDRPNKGTVPFGSSWSRVSWIAWLGAGIAVVLLATSDPHWTTTAQGDVRETPRPEMFLSGGARSEVVLREISETLKRIDSRLERFEKALRESDAESSNSRPAAQTRMDQEPVDRGPSANSLPENR